MEKVKKLYVVLVVLFLYAPIGVLVAQSFNASRYRGHWTGFTLQWYGELFQNEGILDALQNTVTIGLSSAAIATVLGLITCMALRGMGRKPRSVFLGVASMPLLNADIVTGISLMLLFLGMGLRLGYGSILMAHVVFNLPYVILCIMPQFLSLDRSCYVRPVTWERRRSWLSAASSCRNCGRASWQASCWPSPCLPMTSSLLISPKAPASIRCRRKSMPN